MVGDVFWGPLPAKPASSAVIIIGAALIVAAMSTFAAAQEVCEGFGPQTPRDITSKSGTNMGLFAVAPAASMLNLCNIHTHTNAEHKGPGFSVFAGVEEHGGYKCNGSDTLTASELADAANGHPAFENIEPGDTIEVEISGFRTLRNYVATGEKRTRGVFLTAVTACQSGPRLLCRRTFEPWLPRRFGRQPRSR